MKLKRYGKIEVLTAEVTMMSRWMGCVAVWKVMSERLFVSFRMSWVVGAGVRVVMFRVCSVSGVFMVSDVL